MRNIRKLCIWFVPVVLAISGRAMADLPTPSDFQPDPRSVQRFGPAYRYPQAGWIVLHIEGEPYERGYQHGRLLAPEIAAFVKNSANSMSPGAPADGWNHARTLINVLFLRRYDPEYLEEMKGIADGASACGAKYDGRPIDLIDVVGLNCWPEIETLPSALEALPTGLEGVRFPLTAPKAMPPPKPMHCSAFAATGPATADGKIVFGHITMFGLYQSYFYNVWLDVKPAKGNRVMMQGYPGAIQSGMDYYQNDKGLLVSETTIAQTVFDINGLSLASRIRKALQYADNIDRAVEILKEGNNGLYTNEWLIADTKTNEIAMFELGTHQSHLYRSSKDEWPGGTKGFYWGCNNTKDLAVRLETIPGVKGRPSNLVFCPSDRDKTWLRLYDQYKGKMDASFAKEAFTTPPLAAYHSLDAKFTTTDLAKDMKSWAIFGPPLGHTWQPSQEERLRHPDIMPLVSNPWTVLHGAPPAPDSGKELAVDLVNPASDNLNTRVKDDGDDVNATRPAWHGTILPANDADIWLAVAFADYERTVAREDALRARDGGLNAGPRNRLAAELYGYRSQYLASARVLADVPLAGIHKTLRQSDWYEIAANKGVLVLQELRRLLGSKAFADMMDSFGREHAGREVTTAEFQAHAEKMYGKPLNTFFSYWLNAPGLPALRLGNVNVAAKGKGYTVEGTIHRDGNAPPAKLQLVVTTKTGEQYRDIVLESAATQFAIDTLGKPTKLVVDPHGLTAKANGGVFTGGTFQHELEQTLIVYGTADEICSNREAAEALQRSIIQTHSNFTVPIKSDQEVTDDDLKTHHVLLIGRPETNRVVQRFQTALPLEYRKSSFSVLGETYAHPGSSVIVAAENPQNPRYSMVVVAGMSAESTLQAAPTVLHQTAAEVVILPNKSRARALVIPAKELTKDLTETPAVSAKSDSPSAGGN
jgi:hypothetical protein